MRLQEHQGYGPGKFEGEPCYTRVAYHWVGEGWGEPIGEEEDDNTERLYGPFTLQEIDTYEQDTGDTVCQECLTDLLQANTLDSWEDSQGFAYSTLG